MPSPRRIVASALVSIVTAFLAVGCTSDAPKNVDNAKCVPICTGSTGGARYEIRVPKKWNGTLLIYSRGYRIDNGTGPGRAMVSQSDTTGTGKGSDDVTSELLQRGYALSGSSYASAGWSVQDGVAAGDALHRLFATKVGTPKRTIVWGTSLGGLVTELLAEKRSWVDGAAPMCGVVAGPVAFADSLLFGAQAAAALLSPKTQIRGWSSKTSAAAAASELADALAVAGRRVDGGVQKLVYLTDTLGIKLPGGSTARSRLAIGKAAATALNQYLSTGIAIRFEMEHRFDGMVGRTDPSKSATPSSATTAQLAALGGNARSLAATVGALPNLRDSVSARAALAGSGTPTGTVRVPTITMHTDLDPLVIPANETVLRNRAVASGTSEKLRQVFIGASPNGNATSYGSSHCDFSTGQQVGLINAIDDWVESGSAPSTAGLANAVGDGADPRYTSPAWPLPLRNQ